MQGGRDARRPRVSPAAAVNEVLQQLKQLLDPNGILNPGKVLRPRH